MKEMDELYAYCLSKYNKGACKKCAYNQCLDSKCIDCYNCLKRVHDCLNNKLYYQCDYIRYNYILKFFNRYASEISYCLYLLFLKSYSSRESVTIYSLGCGPSSELYASIAMARQVGKTDRYIHYYGFDLSTQWNEIMSFNISHFPNANIQYFNNDLFAYIKNGSQHIDILILNYVLSDIMRYDKTKGDVIADQLTEVIKTKRVTHTIINDIPLFYTDSSKASAYFLMNKIEKELKTVKDISTYKYHYVDPNQFQPYYGRKWVKNNLLFHSLNEIKVFQPMPNCGSIILWVKAQ